MAERNLRAVGPDEKPPAPTFVHDKITDALNGSARDVLASMRKALALKLDAGEVASNAISSAYKELRELDRQIRVIDTERATKQQDDGENGSGKRRSFNTEAI